VKKLITNIVATTGLAVILLSIIVRLLLPGYDLFFSYAVFQVFIANIVIHLGLLLTRKFESKYMAIEVILDTAYITMVLIACGLIFDWFGITPIFVLVVMAVIMNFAAFLLNVTRIRDDVNNINKLLQKRNEKLNSSIISKQRGNSNDKQKTCV